MRRNERTTFIGWKWCRKFIFTYTLHIFVFSFEKKKNIQVNCLSVKVLNFYSSLTILSFCPNQNDFTFYSFFFSYFFFPQQFSSCAHTFCVFFESEFMAIAATIEFSFTFLLLLVTCHINSFNECLEIVFVVHRLFLLSNLIFVFYFLFFSDSFSFSFAFVHLRHSCWTISFFLFHFIVVIVVWI